MSKKAKPTVTTSNPWAEAVPYMTGEGGIFPSAQQMFQQGGFTPQMQGLNDQYLQQLQGRSIDPRLGGVANNSLELSNGAMDMARGAVPDLMQGARGIANGAFDSNFGPVGDVGYHTVDAPQTNLVDARKGQGVLDPTKSLKNLLSGNVTNPYLQQQAAAMTANLTRNLNENVMPGIRSEALASGQYGGSRQGIAEGLAASRLNQDLAPALTNMFGGAFENAQQRMAGTANALNDQAYSNAVTNADRNFAGQQFNANAMSQADQFNAGLGLQNNSQLMQKNQSNLGNRMQGLNVAQGASNLMNNAANLNNGSLATLGGIDAMKYGMQDSNYMNAMNALQMPQNFNWQNMGNYAGIISPGAGLGSTQSQTNYKNPISSALGGASAGAMFGPWGAGIGAGLGLLGAI